MSILILLLGTSVVVALIFLGAFLWATKSGQYDDTVTPAERILLDTSPNQSTKTQHTSIQSNTTHTTTHHV